MNIYYLKKFRKKAYNKFSVKKYNKYYAVIYRGSNLWYSTHFNLESAIKSLYETRREHILELLANEKQKRDGRYKKQEKLNKQLAKL